MKAITLRYCSKWDYFISKTNFKAIKDLANKACILLGYYSNTFKEIIPLKMIQSNV